MLRMFTALPTQQLAPATGKGSTDALWAAALKESLKTEPSPMEPWCRNGSRLAGAAKSRWFGASSTVPRMGYRL